jgi:hypothetical protein
VNVEDPDFASGSSGLVLGIRGTSLALLEDLFCDVVAAATMERRRLRRAATAWPTRRVLVLGIERRDEPNVLSGSFDELGRSRHDVSLARIDAGDRGKFENLNALLAEHPPDGHDWLLVVDDDVVLPAGFLDAFVFLAERFGLSLAQPAHRRRSHAAWEVTRRRPASLVRETRFVEIGPLCAFHSRTFETLLPFPPLRIGWGLDAHWSAVARERGWRMGVADATPIRHGLRPIAASYQHDAAFSEAREFLATRPYTRAVEAQRTVATHRSLR